MTTTELAENFKKQLQKIETTGDPKDLVALFADDAVIEAPVRDETRSGTSGAATFWAEYVKAFKSIKSQFHKTYAADETAVLEWTSTGTLTTGRPIEYRGVSVIEFKNDKVTRFATYYDTAAFLDKGK